MNSIVERELQNRSLIYRYIDVKESRKSIAKEYKDAIGTSQWSDMSYNILSTKSACFNDCRYCYVKPMFRRFKIGGDRNVTLTPDLDEKKLEKGWNSHSKSKVIMFPTSHDIFESIVDAYIKVAKKMIGAGHKVLCVSKPRLNCIKKICNELKNSKDQIIFRFTIGSDNNEVLKKWEPNAPEFEERLECLKYAFDNGFVTSVSMEPMLDNFAERTIEKMRPFVTDTIWIGFVSQLPNTDLEDITYEINKSKLKLILNLLERYRTDAMIMWKQSVAKYIFHSLV